MWNKSKNILSPNYITVEETGNDLHFYVTGENYEDIDRVADAVEFLMNTGKKSPFLKKNIVLDEVVLLENHVRIGVAGTVKKIKKDEENGEYTNQDRTEFLREFLKKM